MIDEGHDEPCYYCGEYCNSLAGNPSLWPVALCHTDEPGVVKWHHTGCVSERLEDFKKMAEYYTDISSGDCLYLAEAEDLLNKYDFVDEDGYWKYEE